MLTAAVEGFNLFNSQRPIAVDNNYTRHRGPIIGATQGTVPTTLRRACPETGQTTVATGTAG